ncbi:hypothetical protein P1X14_03525 [Sphingomonas sp. AOB5]|nr:hypothetical protein [Sphingomonas sp. AOB5]MDF7774308.1 hypothetical protein [Sphingomonas sp. AOB5]
MRSLHENAEAFAGSDVERALPPGGGLLIAIAISMGFWGTLAWFVF